MLLVARDGLVVRRALTEDRDKVWPLAREFATSFLLERTAFDRSFDELNCDGNTLLLVAESERKEVIGYLLASIHGTFLANGPVVWVEELMVGERFRRQGVGRALMEEVERWSGALRASYVSLATRRADDFYLELGYESSATFYKKTLLSPG
jgi:GNAT superfamily N-acetyltransferase